MLAHIQNQLQVLWNTLKIISTELQPSYGPLAGHRSTDWALQELPVTFLPSVSLFQFQIQVLLQSKGTWSHRQQIPFTFMFLLALGFGIILNSLSPSAVLHMCTCTHVYLIAEMHILKGKCVALVFYWQFFKVLHIASNLTNTQQHFM